MTLQSASHGRGTGTAQRWEEPFSWEQQEQVLIRAPDTSAAPAVLGAGPEHHVSTHWSRSTAGPGSALPLHPGSRGSSGRLRFLLQQSNPQVALSTSTHGENANTAVLLFMEIAQGVSVTWFGELAQIAALIIAAKYAESSFRVPQ